MNQKFNVKVPLLAYGLVVQTLSCFFLLFCTLLLCLTLDVCLTTATIVITRCDYPRRRRCLQRALVKISACWSSKLGGIYRYLPTRQLTCDVMCMQNTSNLKLPACEIMAHHFSLYRTPRQPALFRDELPIGCRPTQTHTLRQTWTGDLWDIFTVCESDETYMIGDKALNRRTWRCVVNCTMTYRISYDTQVVSDHYQCMIICLHIFFANYWSIFWIKWKIQCNRKLTTISEMHTN